MNILGNGKKDQGMSLALNRFMMSGCSNKSFISLGQTRSRLLSPSNLVVPKQQILEMKEQPEHMTDQGISRTSERRWLPYLSLGKPLPMQFRYNYNLKLYLP